MEATKRGMARAGVIGSSRPAFPAHRAERYRGSALGSRILGRFELFLEPLDCRGVFEALVAGHSADDAARPGRAAQAPAVFLAEDRVVLGRPGSRRATR